MARIRSIKPEFWADEFLAENTCREARMLYIGLWNLADEHGRLRGGVRFLKGQIFPYDDDISADDVTGFLDELVRIGRIVRYAVDGENYVHLPKLAEHQRLEPSKVPSRLPAPVEADPRPDDVPLTLVGESSHESAPRAEDHALCMEPVAGDMEHGTGEGENLSSEIAPRLDVERLCHLLADLIEANGSKRPKITAAWRDACRLLLDRDGRAEQQVENAIRWSQADEFWRSNVLSMPKLREKYDQLRLAAQRAGPKLPPQRTSTTDERVRQALALRDRFAALEGPA